MCNLMELLSTEVRTWRCLASSLTVTVNDKTILESAGDARDGVCESLLPDYNDYESVAMIIGALVLRDSISILGTGGVFDTGSLSMTSTLRIDGGDHEARITNGAKWGKVSEVLIDGSLLLMTPMDTGLIDVDAVVAKAKTYKSADYFGYEVIIVSAIYQSLLGGRPIAGIVQSARC